MVLTRQRRALVVIAGALAALGMGVAYQVLPRVASPSPVQRLAVSPPATPGRPLGVLHLAGRDIPAPRLAGDEYGFMVALAGRGVAIQRIDDNSWSRLFDQAVVDTVITDQDVYFVFAPASPGHPLWVCPASDAGATIGGGDAPSLEVGIGGDRASLQVPGGTSFGRFGEALVMAPSRRGWERIRGVTSPVDCPEK